MGLASTPAPPTARRPAAAGWALLLFLLAHGHAHTAALALPLLLTGLGLAAARGEIDFSRRPDALEWGLVAWGLAWLCVALAGLDPQRAMLPAVPLLAVLLATWSIRRSIDATRAQGLCLLGLALLAVSAAFQVLIAAAYAGTPEARVEASRIPWMAVPNDLAWAGCLWPLWWQRWRSPHMRMSLALLAVLLALALWLLESRLGLLLLALALGLTVLAAPSPAARLIGRSPRWTVPVVLAGSATLLLPLWLLFLEKGVQSLQARLQLWEAAWAVFLQRPWLGVGPGGFVDVYPSVIQAPLIDPRLTSWPHSLPLELLAEGGILLASASVAVLVLALRRSDFAARGALAVGVPFLLFCLVEASLLRLWFALVLLLLLSGVRCDTRRHGCDGPRDGRHA